MKQGFENMITEAEAGLGLKGAANKPYKGRAPVFAIDDDSDGESIFSIYDVITSNRKR